MPKPYRTPRERRAYEVGYAAGRAANQTKQQPALPAKPLTLDQIRAMSVQEVNERWAEVQASLQAMTQSKGGR